MLTVTTIRNIERQIAKQNRALYIFGKHSVNMDNARIKLNNIIETLYNNDDIKTYWFDFDIKGYIKALHIIDYELNRYTITERGTKI